jgi:hypothetical protein
MKFEVSWIREIAADYAAAAAVKAAEMLRGTNPEDFVFFVKEVKKSAHRVSVAVEPGRRPERSMADIDPDNLLEDILQAAQAHGEESEPDHEVGDLQDTLRLAWAKLSLEAQLDVHKELANGTIYTWMQVRED